MFQFKRDFNDDFCRARSVAATRQLNPELLDFSAWLARYKDKIPLNEVADPLRVTSDTSQTVERAYEVGVFLDRACGACITD
jgi:hypothetical protein